MGNQSGKVEEILIAMMVTTTMFRESKLEDLL